MILVLSTVLRRQNKWITSKAGDVGGKALMGNLAEMLSKALKTKTKLEMNSINHISIALKKKKKKKLW